MPQANNPVSVFVTQQFGSQGVGNTVTNVFARQVTQQGVYNTNMLVAQQTTYASGINYQNLNQPHTGYVQQLNVKI
ncbi:unnamed protein product [Meloidogyne enterolobii]|uniref:Uncharacterized protein n=1 Tax=Meloidogyne enterolobii TaxID=390850 RepID=A0ACB1AQ38_MELEN